MMLSENKILFMLSILLIGICSSCTHTEEDAVKDAAVLIPDTTWTCSMPEGIPIPEEGAPVFEATMALDQIYEIGKTQYGDRTVIVTREGILSGEKIKGKVLAGSLDFELMLSNGIVEIEQVLVIQTDDGKIIYARNAGVGLPGSASRVVMDFEAPNESDYAWLNTGQFVARRNVDPAARTLTLSVYDVATVLEEMDTAGSVRVEKPDDAPPQPWDPRMRDAAEQQGEEIIVETVTLGDSISVGASKRGGRNIIPITGGDLSGQINGKVLFGGADYQNLGNPMTLDARYLWQTDDGEVIIVRNAGGFGAMIPTFEARIDGNYAWLNSGRYISSNPGMGSGGVSLTFYRSE